MRVPMGRYFRKEIEKIIDGMKCPKDFECAKLEFKHLCRARDVGLESYLECVAENPQDCKFSLFFGDGNFCHCPLRVYIAKRLKK
jgi:hypothetical protein